MGALGLYHIEELTPSKDLFLESIAMSISVGDTYGVTSDLVFLAGICARSSHVACAIKVLGYVEKRMAGYFKVMDDWDQVEYDRLVSAVKLAVEPAAFDAFWQHGHTMSQEQALNEARE